MYFAIKQTPLIVALDESVTFEMMPDINFCSVSIPRGPGPRNIIRALL